MTECFNFHYYTFDRKKQILWLFISILSEFSWNCPYQCSAIIFHSINDVKTYDIGRSQNFLTWQGMKCLVCTYDCFLLVLDTGFYPEELSTLIGAVSLLRKMFSVWACSYWDEVGHAFEGRLYIRAWFPSADISVSVWKGWWHLTVSISNLASISLRVSPSKFSWYGSPLSSDDAFSWWNLLTEALQTLWAFADYIKLSCCSRIVFQCQFKLFPSQCNRHCLPRIKYYYQNQRMCFLYFERLTPLDFDNDVRVCYIRWCLLVVKNYVFWTVLRLCWRTRRTGISGIHEYCFRERSW